MNNKIDLNAVSGGTGYNYDRKRIAKAAASGAWKQGKKDKSLDGALDGAVQGAATSIVTQQAEQTIGKGATGVLSGAASSMSGWFSR